MNTKVRGSVVAALGKGWGIEKQALKLVYILEVITKTPEENKTPRSNPSKFRSAEITVVGGG
jgi:hypothetical protein